ncbi:hypothetical protein BH23ACT9_BH23ACT9_04170 [soil metagenome]
MQISEVEVSDWGSDAVELPWDPWDLTACTDEADVAGFDVDALEVPFDPYLVDSADPIDRAVADLRCGDAAMARVLRAVQEAGPRDGLSVRRQVGLLAGATGTDVGFLDRAVQTLSAMPQTWASFDRGWISWSQVRAVVLEARRLSVAQRRVLDGALAGALLEARDRGEPDRLVEVCGDIAARLDREGQERVEEAQERAQRLVIQLGFDGWSEVHGALGPELTSTVGEALDAAADAPVADPDEPVTDDDGRPLPRMPLRPSASGVSAADGAGVGRGRSGGVGTRRSGDVGAL